MSTPSAAETDEPVVEIDLTRFEDRLDRGYAERFDEEHILEWLRSSGGTLAERYMKQAAADLIESQQP